MCHVEQKPRAQKWFATDWGWPLSNRDLLAEIGTWATSWRTLLPRHHSHIHPSSSSAGAILQADQCSLVVWLHMAEEMWKIKLDMRVITCTKWKASIQQYCSKPTWVLNNYYQLYGKFKGVAKCKRLGSSWCHCSLVILPLLTGLATFCTGDFCFFA